MKKVAIVAAVATIGLYSVVHAKSVGSKLRHAGDKVSKAATDAAATLKAKVQGKKREKSTREVAEDEAIKKVQQAIDVVEGKLAELRWARLSKESKELEKATGDRLRTAWKKVVETTRDTVENVPTTAEIAREIEKEQRVLESAQADILKALDDLKKVSQQTVSAKARELQGEAQRLERTLKEITKSLERLSAS